MDIAKRCEQNPLLAPKNLKAGIDGMEITCLLNPGVFRIFKTKYLATFAHCRTTYTKRRYLISFPIYNKEEIEVVSFSKHKS